ncbi:MAG: DUF3240 family protein [Sulfuricurvum sp.]|jgi:hypothetical protein|uniref:DUF3240 family protein n=1 Tax=Sulfuricurvum sp. TaxID=2025608 RepID=UPI0025E83100|nr:DUF3240 family protein [Sulfuricurvum sp.]MCK9371832.1 DUF3240 family protein [Sulfuricurvum sp.]
MSLKGMEIYFEMGHKDTLVDFLLAQGYDGFYFFPCDRYGAGAFLISAQEQVSARREFGMFRLFVSAETIGSLSLAIRSELKEDTITIVTYEVHEA